MEQFTITSEKCGLIEQSVPAVTKDIFDWTVQYQGRSQKFVWGGIKFYGEV